MSWNEFFSTVFLRSFLKVSFHVFYHSESPLAQKKVFFSVLRRHMTSIHLFDRPLFIRKEAYNKRMLQVSFLSKKDVSKNVLQACTGLVYTSFYTKWGVHKSIFEASFHMKMQEWFAGCFLHKKRCLKECFRGLLSYEKRRIQECFAGLFFYEKSHVIERFTGLFLWEKSRFRECFTGLCWYEGGMSHTNVGLALRRFRIYGLGFGV